jgi:hypothetical protein
VEDGGLGMAGNKARPARILQRIDGEDAHEFGFGRRLGLPIQAAVPAAE